MNNVLVPELWLKKWLGASISPLTKGHTSASAFVFQHHSPKPNTPHLMILHFTIYVDELSFSA